MTRVIAHAKAKGHKTNDTVSSKDVAARTASPASVQGGDDEEEYEEVSWLTEKLEDAVASVQAVVAAVPGPRVGSSAAPWLVVLPAAYLSITFVVAAIRTVQRLNSPTFKRKRQVNKNAGLMESLEAALRTLESPGGEELFTPAQFRALAAKFWFTPAEVVRKYVRYTLDEKPFSPSVVASLLQFRRASELTDDELADVLNDVARRRVKAKGRVMMDTAGMTEKGLQRKAAVQAFFSKLLYLSELDDFCSPAAREKLEIKEIFGVTDEDVDKVQIDSLSSTEDLDKLEGAFDEDSAE